jgi:predicted metal-dependent TIM-barrel fold hydrolase
MYKTVEMSGALLNLLAHVIIDLHVKDIGHEIERILVVLDFSVKASQVEAVGEVVFVDFAIVFIAARRDEL